MKDFEPRACLEIEPGERFVRYGDLAHRLAKALHPTRLEDDSLDYGFTRAQFDTELAKAVHAGAVVPRNPLTGGPHEFPHGAALEESVISLRDLQAFAKERDIGVRVRGEQPPTGWDAPTLAATTKTNPVAAHFITSAWPKSVPPELQRLPALARITYEHSIAGQRGNGETTAGQYLDELRETIGRQAAGYFTPNEAAQVLADSRPGLAPVALVKRLLSAHAKGELPIHQGGSRFKLDRGETVRDFHDLLEAAELDSWLRASAGYGFPAAVTIAPVAAESPPLEHWKMRIQAEAAAQWKRLRAMNCNPTRESIRPYLLKWCRENNVKTGGDINPSDGYLRTHVLGGKHWRPPAD